MNFYENLDAICKLRNTTISAVCAKCNISSGTANNWKVKGIAPSGDKIISLAVELDTTPNQLLGFETVNELSDEEEKLMTFYRLLSSENKTVISNAVEQRLPNKPIKRYTDKVSAGIGFDLTSSTQEKIYVLSNKESKNADYAVMVEGDSMLPLFEDGDTLLVQKEVEVLPGQIGVFVINGESGYVKRLGDHCLISENKQYKPIPIHKEDILECKGLVLGKATVLTHISL